MGRRAKKAPVQTKKRVVLAKRFKCPFCGNDDTVECEMKHKEGTGSLKCRMCDASFQMPIHHLHEPVDVFSEWLDECEAAEKRSRGGGGASASASGGGLVNGAGGGRSGVGYVDDAAQQGYDYDSDEDDLGEGSGLKSVGGGGSGGGKKKGSQQQQHSLSSLGVVDSDDESD